MKNCLPLRDVSTKRVIKPSEYLSAKRTIMASRYRVEVLAIELSKLGNGLGMGGGGEEGLTDNYIDRLSEVRRDMI